MNGLIHIYCGDGKGKTTATLGLALRACGSGYTVILVQFLKSRNTGELNILNKMEEVVVLRGEIQGKFTWHLDDEEKTALKIENNRIFEKSIAAIVHDKKTLVIFDEVIGAIEKNLIDREAVLGFLKNKPLQAEVVLTGRNPDGELIRLADYVSEIKKIKHPFDHGVKAREGIEY